MSRAQPVNAAPCMVRMKAGRMVAVGRMECEEIAVPTLGRARGGVGRCVADPHGAADAAAADAVDTANAADPANAAEAAVGGVAPTRRLGTVLGPGPAAVPHDVIVRTEMASICGSDLHMVMMGAGLAYQPPCPHGFPGHEGIGIVTESRAPGLPEGTHVLTFPNPPQGECFNAYQRIDSRYCLTLPPCDLPRSHLLMAQQLGTVIYALRRCPRDVSGETAMVIGQGSAGLFFTHLLKRAGAERVIVSDLSPARLAVAEAYGVPLFPSVYVIAPDGTVAFRRAGSTALEELRAAVEAALGN